MLPRVEEVGVSAIEGDLIRGVPGAGDCGRGVVMVAIAMRSGSQLVLEAYDACYCQTAGSKNAEHAGACPRLQEFRGGLVATTLDLVRATIHRTKSDLVSHYAASGATVARF